VAKYRGKRPLGMLRRLEVNFKMDIREIGCEDWR
jgi:hypothetical protein